MGIAIGVTSAVAVGIFARLMGLDRDRSFYPTVMTVIALIYVLFATIGGSTQVLITEMAVGTVFIVVAMLGFKKSQWFTVAALAGHGVFDFFHPHVIHNDGVPAFWPDFCMAYDVAAAVFLAWLLKRGASL